MATVGGCTASTGFFAGPDGTFVYLGAVEDVEFDGDGRDPVEAYEPFSGSFEFRFELDEDALDLVFGKWRILIAGNLAMRVRRRDYDRAMREGGDAVVVPPVLLMAGCSKEQAASWLMDEPEGACWLAAMFEDGSVERFGHSIRWEGIL